MTLPVSFAHVIERLDQFTIVAAALSAVLSAIGVGKTVLLRKTLERAASLRKAPITIRVHAGGKSIDLPYRIRRDQLSRQELIGVLAMYKADDKRFDPAIFRNAIESGELDRVLNGEDAVIQVRDTLNLHVPIPVLNELTSSLASLSYSNT